MSKKWIKSIPLLLYGFLFIYMPNIILPFNILHILAFISYLFFLSNRYKILPYIKQPTLKIFVRYHLFSVFYIVFLYLLMSGDILAAYSHILILFEIIPISIFISLVLIKLKFNKYDFYNFILSIGFIQVLIVLLTMINPNLRDLLLVDYASKEFDSLFSIVSKFRLYGLTRNYTFAMPLFQGLCIIIAAVLGSFKSKKYFLLIPFYIISIAVNARIALISIFIVGMVLLLMWQKGSFVRQFTSVILISAVLYALYEIISTQAAKSVSINTWFWLKQGIDESILFTEGETTGNLHALTQTMWFTPDNKLEYLMGTGNIPFRQIGGRNSDIGYVQIFYFGGLIYSLLVYAAFYVPIFRLLKKSQTEERILFVSILIYLFSANLKGNAFNAAEHINGVILIIVFFTILIAHKLYDYKYLS